MSAKRQLLKSAADLVDAGLVDQARRADVERVSARYSVAITPAMAALVDKSDPWDPIARQFIPNILELDHRPEELADPIGDNLKSPVKGIVHRYPDRVLLKVVGVCPVYCRFCFRREMVGPELGVNLSREEIGAALGYIRAHPEIFEVILTGGDPFMLSAERMAQINAELDGIAHVKVVRWHTRVPVVAPERVTGAIVETLRRAKKSTFVAIHINHARELTEEARAALGRLADAGIPLLSQSVLLKGVNDDANVLEDLMRALLCCRVKPYYLHHADLAPGTAHFRTSISKGQQLMRELRRRLSGIALPTYVVDIPGAHGKVPAGPGYVFAAPGGGGTVITDPAGASHRLPDVTERG
jgi:lysine 2,3-aminomutase